MRAPRPSILHARHSHTTINNTSRNVLPVPKQEATIGNCFFAGVFIRRSARSPSLIFPSRLRKNLAKLCSGKGELLAEATPTTMRIRRQSLLGEFIVRVRMRSFARKLTSAAGTSIFNGIIIHTGCCYRKLSNVGHCKQT